MILRKSNFLNKRKIQNFKPIIFISDEQTSKGITMALPSSSNKVWSDLVSGSKQVEFDFLAVKIFLGTAQRNFKANNSDLPKLAGELYALFEKNQNLPAVQKDIAKLG